MKKAIVALSSTFLPGILSVYGLFRVVFCYPRRLRPTVRQIPDSDLYRAHKDKMLHVIEEMENAPGEEVHIVSIEGLQLYGKLYYGQKDAPLILFFHGYHGTSAWDGYGIFKLCRANGYPLLMVDERAHGKSEGKTITFGIRERCDCKSWVEFAVKRYGENTDIFLAGVSMGAASVMMASNLGLPGNVRGIIADCGYLGPADIIKQTVRQMKLPVKPLYWLIRLGARLFGHFDTEADTALKAVRRTEIPILFIHGSQDSIVPPAMGKALYEACHSSKEWLLIEGADHANSAMTDYETYAKKIREFIRENSTYV